MQAWRPYRKKDIDTLECIQRRATKIIPELRDLIYEERLKECGLTTLKWPISSVIILPRISRIARFRISRVQHVLAESTKNEHSISPFLPTNATMSCLSRSISTSSPFIFAHPPHSKLKLFNPGFLPTGLDEV